MARRFKADLIAYAAKLGLDLDGRSTIAEIEKAIKKRERAIRAKRQAKEKAKAATPKRDTRRSTAAAAAKTMKAPPPQYVAVCQVALPNGKRVKPGEVCPVSGSIAEKLLKSGAIRSE